MSRSSALHVLAATFALSALCAGGGRPAAAQQFDVTTTADAGAGSLRAALAAAAAASGADDVVVQPGLGTITLASPLEWSGIAGTNPVTIEGNGVRLDFAGAPRGLVDDFGRGVTVRNMEITGVGGSVSQDAAAVLSEGGVMLVEGCTIFDNHVTTDDGDGAGAVLNEGGPVTIRNCTIRGNTVSCSGDGCGGALSEGGDLIVEDSVLEANVANADGDACGAIHSEGGGVTVTNVTVQCNEGHAAAGGDAGGGLLNEGGALTVSNSRFDGNRATVSGTGVGDDGTQSFGPVPSITTTTISDDRNPCGPAIESFLVPAKVTFKLNAKDAALSALSASGVMDVGPDGPDLTAAATLDAGGLSFPVASLTRKGKSFALLSNGASFKITPDGSGTSRATFSLKVVGDFTGKIDAESALTVRFTGDAFSAVGTVDLAAGKFKLGKVRGTLEAPNLRVVSAKASIRGGGNDALKMTLGFDSDGTTPQTAPDVTLGFGALSVVIPSGSFVKRKDTFVLAAPVGGITKAVLDYAHETITISGKRLDVGAFAPGPDVVLVSLALGTDARAVRVRMVRKGASLRY